MSDIYLPVDQIGRRVIDEIDTTKDKIREVENLIKKCTRPSVKYLSERGRLTERLRVLTEIATTGK